ncbi:Guanylate-binding protein like [Heracleum sosnowskyi]|uniref:Guanylate-binding protein like n=1 Tax=Heracleum sosnowskyi TaxID=360622 RepID=A0AAD8HF03_9APIA|nr:Guanylate-binding protein like [Heracleum sosnowskyi]
MRRFFSRGSGEDSPATPSPEPPPYSPYTATPPVPSGPPRAIRLVYCDENGKFKMDPEAVAVLQLLKEPVGVVSVCGRARQGKSFILNQLLGRSSGFQVASTHRPCTKGLWLWSTPLRRTALDGTVYNLLLLDSEGIDAYDQTGTYSTQIFSLAVLLSSMFIYNQIGGIDEASLDRLSLVTEMSKRIRVRASGEKSTASEIGQFSPIFVWLLRDFYLDLVEDNRRITPRDYLEIALRPVQGNKRDVAAKNEIRESIRALFPDRECFTLVRPSNNENDLQKLDQLPLHKLRPEFRSGLDAFTTFIFERARPKQIGGTVMTGPIFARITQSYLDALNNGVVPTITSSWQSVEEAECQRAYDIAAEVYVSTFDRSRPPEEASLREAHEEAIQKSMAAFDATAVGSGSTRQKHELRLKHFLRKAFEDHKKDAFREASLQCSNAVQSMEKDLRAACNAPNARVDNVFKVLDGLLSKYEASSHGPEKWRKCTIFLQQSLEGPVSDLIKKQMDQIGSEKSSIMLKCRSIEDKMGLLNRQLEASEKYKSEYLKRSRSSAAEARLAAAREQNKSAQDEAGEWKRKYDIAVREAKNALEKAAAVQERSNKQTQLREDALREEFSVVLADKELELRDKTTKIEHAEQRLTTLSLEMKTAESKIKSYDMEIASLKHQIKDLGVKLESVKATAQSFEREARTMEQEKVHLEEKYRSEFNRFEEVQQRCKSAEGAAKRATELADNARAEAVTAQKEKSDAQRIAMERQNHIEKAKRHLESLDRQKTDLAAELERYKISEMDARSKVAMLEARVEEREKEIESLLLSNNEQRANTVQVLESLLETERAARTEATNRAESLSVQLQATQGKLDLLQQQMTSVRLNETALDSKLKTASCSKRVRIDDYDGGMDSVHDMELNGRTLRGSKRTRSSTSPLQFTREGGGSIFMGEEQNNSQQTSSEDYTKFTVQKLKQELTKHNYGAEVLELKNPSKKDFVALYEKCVLQKS